MWIFNKKQPELKSGVLEDIRNDEEKKLDYKLEEALQAQPITWSSYSDWLQTDAANWHRALLVHDQDGSSSCVGNAIASIATILNALEEKAFIHFSPRWIYAQRMNRPSPGMYFNDASQIFVDNGILPESLCHSDGLPEDKMNELNENKIESFTTIAKIYSPQSYFWINGDIDSIAQALSIQRPVLIGVRFGDNEWGRDVPIVTQTELKYCHAVTILPNSYFMYNNKKAVMIIDSWGTSNPLRGFRILTEDWFNNTRLVSAICFTDLPNPTLSPAEHWEPFLQDLGWGSKGEEVKRLQLLLQTKYGIFKGDITGNYYGYTTACVKELQKLLKVEPVSGYFGPITRKALNATL